MKLFNHSRHCAASMLVVGVTNPGVAPAIAASAEPATRAATAQLLYNSGQGVERAECMTIAVKATAAASQRHHRVLWPDHRHDALHRPIRPWNRSPPGTITEPSLYPTPNEHQKLPRNPRNF